MAQVTDQLAAFNKAQLEAALELAEAAADQMQKLAELQFKAAKASYTNSVSALRQLAQAKDVSDLANTASGLAQPAMEQASGYAKELYGVVASAQKQFATNIEQQVSELNQRVLSALDTAMKSAPPGSEAAVAAAKSAVQSTNAVYEAMVKAAKQLATVSEANVASTVSAVGGKKK